MPSDSGESRSKASKGAPGAPPPEQEHLPCPRCDSTNTKFCYYNNYNFSQPRHFCKSCRRYWTHGGTLRDIPVGGGTRKNAKRSRTYHHYTTASSAAAAADLHHPLPATPVLLPQCSAVHFGDLKAGVGLSGSFTSLLNTQGPGFLALSGFGLGLEDMGFGLGRGVFPFPGVGDASANGGGATGGNVMGNTWQFENGEGGFVGGDCFSWPDLAISTPGNALK